MTGIEQMDVRTGAVHVVIRFFAAAAAIGTVWHG